MSSSRLFVGLLSLVAALGIVSTRVSAQVLTCVPERKEYSAAELAEAKEKAIQQAPIPQEEKDRLRAGLTVKNGHSSDSATATTSTATNTITINVTTTSIFAPPGSPYAASCLAQVILHEIFHVDPPPTGGGGGGGGSGGIGPSSGGVPGGKDCKHIGLQYWASLQTCTAAGNAISSGNTGLAEALCRQLRGSSGPLRKVGAWKGAYYDAAQACSQQAGHTTTPGPGSWGFPFPPFDQGVCEPCQVNHLGGF